MIRHHLGSVISMSLGATERTFPSRQSIMGLRSAFIDASSGRNMITLVAASGDVGAAGLMLNGKTVYRTPQIGWPASDPLVIAVGGTQLGAQSLRHGHRPGHRLAAERRRPVRGVPPAAVPELARRDRGPDPGHP